MRHPIGFRKLAIYRGDNDQLTTAWDWHSAYATDSIYTILNPQGNPAIAGFPFSLHVTVTIFSADGAVPQAPTGLTAEVVDSRRIDLRLQDNSDNGESLKVDRHWKGSWQRIAELPGGTTSYSDTTLSPDKIFTTGCEPTTRRKATRQPRTQPQAGPCGWRQPYRLTLPLRSMVMKFTCAGQHLASRKMLLLR